MLSAWLKSKDQSEDKILHKRDKTLLQAIIENSPSIIFIKDLEGKYLLVNPAFETFANKSWSEIIGYTTDDVFPEHSGDFRLHDLEMLEQREAVSEEFSPIIAGKKQTLRITKFPLFDEDEEIYAICGIGIDISDKEEMTKNLDQARKVAEHSRSAMSRFVANISHEIRTPLTGILGVLDICLQMQPPDELCSNISLMKQSAESMKVIIDDILDLSKIEAGKLEIVSKTFDLHNLLKKSMAGFQLAQPSQQLAFSLTIDDDVPRLVQGDPERILQILRNIISNSIKFTVQGEISVRASINTNKDLPGNILFTVQDTGVGMSDKQQQRLFSETRRFESASYDTAQAGTGLGMTITKELMNILGGHLWVKSLVDEGTTVFFTLSLPEADDSEVAEGSLLDDSTTVSLPSLSILLAENDHLIVKYITHSLEKNGHKVVQASNGHHVLRILKDQQFDLILMDIQMPEMDGVETCKAIRSNTKSPCHDIPIIAFTAYAMKGDRERFLEAGMNGYIPKPVSVPNLLSSIASVLQQKKT